MTIVVVARSFRSTQRRRLLEQEHGFCSITLLYNVFRSKIPAEFRWWDEVDQLGSRVGVTPAGVGHRRRWRQRRRRRTWWMRPREPLDIVDSGRGRGSGRRGGCGLGQQRW